MVAVAMENKIKILSLLPDSVESVKTVKYCHCCHG
jgi:hypothetical protein